MAEKNEARKAFDRAMTVTPQKEKKAQVRRSEPYKLNIVLTEEDENNLEMLLKQIRHRISRRVPRGGLFTALLTIACDDTTIRDSLIDELIERGRQISK